MNNSNKRIIVTGASGFLGRAIMPILLSQGVEVMALTTKPEELTEKLGIQAVDLNKLSEADNVERVQGFSPEILLHLGWGRLPDYSTDACLSNVVSSVEIVRVAMAAGVRRVVVTGSCWEYGDQKGQLKEEVGNPNPSSMFAQSKNALRLLLDSASRETDLQVRWARVFYAYGPGQRDQSLIPLSIRSWQNGAAPNLRDTSSAIDLIHVEDVAGALVALALRDGPSGIFNVGSGSAARVGDVVEFIRDAIASEDTETVIPPAKDSLASWADISSMKSGFGWSPSIELRDGIKSIIYG